MSLFFRPWSFRYFPMEAVWLKCVREEDGVSGTSHIENDFSFKQKSIQLPVFGSTDTVVLESETVSNH